MKKLLILLMALSLLLLAALPVSATEGISATYPVTQNGKNVKIDGVLSEGEWGAPVASYTFDSIMANKNIGWEAWKFSPVPAGQKITVYATNDGDFMYMACTLDHATYDMSCEKSADLWEHPHFGFTLCEYNEKTIVNQTHFAGDDYEIYAHYIVGFVNGAPGEGCHSQGMPIQHLDASDYSCSYNAQNSTYTFEVRVPYYKTTVDINRNNNVVSSFDIGDGKIGDKSGNRFMVSRAAEQANAGGGAYNFCHAKNSPVIITFLKTAEMVSPEFVPTAEEAEAAENRTSNTIISYDTIADTDWKMDIITIAAIITSCIAVAALVFTLVVIFNRKKSAGKED